jgi:hypothetical protein
MRTFGILACALPLLCVAQNWSDTLAVRMAAWNVVRERSDTLTLDEVMDDDWRINQELGEALAAVLRVPGLSDGALDSIFTEGLRPVRSADGRLWIFEWDERTGGSFQAEVHLVFYRDGKGEGHPVFTFDLGDSIFEDDKRWSRGGGYGAIHQLGLTDSSMLYMCVGGVKGCSTCCSELLTVLELTANGINFNYPAFEYSLDDKGPTWELTSRCGDVTDFAYDPKTKVARYTYITDDITPVATNYTPGDTISGMVRFDGRVFVVE